MRRRVVQIKLDEYKLDIQTEEHAHAGARINGVRNALLFDVRRVNGAGLARDL